MTQALDGIRVLDVTQVMAGPYCAMLLCDMGADVIKVEAPSGDSSRHMAGARGTDSAAFNAVNRGKRGIVVDLKSADGQALLRRLAGTADVLVENYRPGVMRRFGLDYDALSAGNTRLIYASISGYGQTGPSAGKGGFDLVAQGVSGLMSVTGEPGRPPVKIGVPVTDLGAGLFAACGILAALNHRERTGRGQHIDTSLVDAGVALSVWEATELFSSGTVPQPLGSAHRMSAPYQAVRCADGYITLGGRQRPAVSAGGGPPAASGMGRRSRLRDRQRACGQSRPPRGTNRRGHGRGYPAPLAGPARSARRSLRPDQRLPRGDDRPPRSRARAGRRDRPSDPGADLPRSARPSSCRRPRSRPGVRRRSLDSIRTRCFARRGTRRPRSSRSERPGRWRRWPPIRSRSSRGTVSGRKWCPRRSGWSRRPDAGSASPADGHDSIGVRTGI